MASKQSYRCLTHLFLFCSLSFCTSQLTSSAQVSSFSSLPSNPTQIPVFGTVLGSGRRASSATKQTELATSSTTSSSLNSPDNLESLKAEKSPIEQNQQLNTAESNIVHKFKFAFHNRPHHHAYNGAPGGGGHFATLDDDDDELLLDGRSSPSSSPKNRPLRHQQYEVFTSKGPSGRGASARYLPGSTSAIYVDSSEELVDDFVPASHYQQQPSQSFSARRKEQQNNFARERYIVEDNSGEQGRLTERNVLSEQQPNNRTFKNFVIPLPTHRLNDRSLATGVIVISQDNGFPTSFSVNNRPNNEHNDEEEEEEEDGGDQQFGRQFHYELLTSIPAEGDQSSPPNGDQILPNLKSDSSKTKDELTKSKEANDNKGENSAQTAKREIARENVFGRRQNDAIKNEAQTNSNNVERSGLTITMENQHKRRLPEQSVRPSVSPTNDYIASSLKARIHLTRPSTNSFNINLVKTTTTTSGDGGKRDDNEEILNGAHSSDHNKTEERETMLKKIRNRGGKKASRGGNSDAENRKTPEESETTTVVRPRRRQKQQQQQPEVVAPSPTFFTPTTSTSINLLNNPKSANFVLKQRKNDKLLRLNTTITSKGESSSSSTSTTEKPTALEPTSTSILNSLVKELNLALKDRLRQLENFNQTVRNAINGGQTSTTITTTAEPPTTTESTTTLFSSTTKEISLKETSSEKEGGNSSEESENSGEIILSTTTQTPTTLANNISETSVKRSADEKVDKSSSAEEPSVNKNSSEEENDNDERVDEMINSMMEKLTATTTLSPIKITTESTSLPSDITSMSKESSEETSITMTSGVITTTSTPSSSSEEEEVTSSEEDNSSSEEVTSTSAPTTTTKSTTTTTTTAASTTSTTTAASKLSRKKSKTSTPVASISIKKSKKSASLKNTGNSSAKVTIKPSSTLSSSKSITLKSAELGNSVVTQTDADHQPIKLKMNVSLPKRKVSVSSSSISSQNQNNKSKQQSNSNKNNKKSKALRFALDISSSSSSSANLSKGSNVSHSKESHKKEKSVEKTSTTTTTTTATPMTAKWNSGHLVWSLWNPSSSTAKTTSTFSSFSTAKPFTTTSTSTTSNGHQNQWNNNKKEGPPSLDKVVLERRPPGPPKIPNNFGFANSIRESENSHIFDDEVIDDDEKTSTESAREELTKRLTASAENKETSSQRPNSALSSPIIKKQKQETPKKVVERERDFEDDDDDDGSSNNDDNGDDDSEDDLADTNVPGTPGVDYPVLGHIPETGFDCSSQQYPGFYADMEVGCQVYHSCSLAAIAAPPEEDELTLLPEKDQSRAASSQVSFKTHNPFYSSSNSFQTAESSPTASAAIVRRITSSRKSGLNGGKHSFLCPNGTIFSQEYLICDWWYNVKCNESPRFYPLNRDVFTSGRGQSSSGTSNQAVAASASKVVSTSVYPGEFRNVPVNAKYHDRIFSTGNGNGQSESSFLTGRTDLIASRSSTSLLFSTPTKHK